MTPTTRRPPEPLPASNWQKADGRLRLAFQSYLGDRWLAGLTAVASIVHGLRSLGDSAPEMALVVYKQTDPAGYESVRPYLDRIIEMAPPRDGQPVHEVKPTRSLRHLFKPNRTQPAVRLHRELAGGWRPDCVFTTPRPQRPDLGAPLILYLPDLQHVHLPQMFTAKEQAERDETYRREMERATLVLATAEDVRRDIEQFAPAEAGKVRVLPFVVPLPEWLYERDPAELAAAYHLPERFFWIPNQFWKHKNHQAVLEALVILQKEGIYPNVVCAGNPVDNRDPGYFAGLLKKVSQWNLREQFIFLGLLPHEEIVTLMRQAICLLNPSLFEGFGFSVAESKLVGKRALLSDLPSHREQSPPGALYFDPADSQALAAKMAEIWRTAGPGPDLTMEAAARQAYPGRQQAFGRAFLELVEEAMTLWQR